MILLLTKLARRLYNLKNNCNYIYLSSIAGFFSPFKDQDLEYWWRDRRDEITGSAVARICHRKHGVFLNVSEHIEGLNLNLHHDGL